jgi:hypothetical protein
VARIIKNLLIAFCGQNERLLVLTGSTFGSHHVFYDTVFEKRNNLVDNKFHILSMGI